MSLHDWIEVVKGIPLFVAASVGLYGISSWLRETRWKKSMSLLRKYYP